MSAGSDLSCIAHHVTAQGDCMGVTASCDLLPSRDMILHVVSVSMGR